METTKKKTYVVYTISYSDQIVYVGKTSNFNSRKSAHKTQRGNPKYSAIPVDIDMSKVVFNVVSVFDNKEEALKCEDQLILQYNTIGNGWNIRRSGLIAASDMKAYKRDYNREYWQAHREELSAQKRDYYEAHKEELSAQKREYYEANREHIRAQQREYYLRKKAEAIASAS